MRRPTHTYVYKKLLRMAWVYIIYKYLMQLIMLQDFVFPNAAPMSVLNPTV